MLHRQREIFGHALEIGQLRARGLVAMGFLAWLFNARGWRGDRLRRRSDLLRRLGGRLLLFRLLDGGFLGLGGGFLGLGGGFLGLGGGFLGLGGGFLGVPGGGRLPFRLRRALDEAAGLGILAGGHDVPSLHSGRYMGGSSRSGPVSDIIRLYATV
jgi:hypothetical protein